MYRSILVTLDGSPLAEQALPLAARLAAASGATLHLLTVHQWMASWTPRNPFTMDLEQLDAAARAEKEAYLRQQAEDMLRRFGARCVVALVSGAVAEQVERFVATNRIELVVMTTHGRGGFSRFWLGSIADRLIRSLAVPILLYRPDPETAAVPAHPVSRVLVALDGSAHAEAALAAAAALAQTAGDAELELFMDVEPAPIIVNQEAVAEIQPEVPTADRREIAANYLATLCGSLGERGITASATALVADDPATTMIAAALRLQAGAIAIATRGAGGLSRLLLGSVTDKVVRSSPIPVLVCHSANRTSRLAPGYVRAITRQRSVALRAH
jgi:nucleotide-binding universal stress UspA family protein